MRLYHWDALTFGNGIRLNVLPSDSFKAPVLFVMSPLSPGPDVCLATEFRPKLGQMVLSVNNGAKVTLNTGSAVLSPKTKSYFFAGFTNEKLDSCQLHSESGEKHQPVPCPTVEPTEPEPNGTDAEPGRNAERTRLNFFLLLMNGVRLVFIKTLAFNTILTIRAVIF